ncbi:MAG: flippase [Chloroflexi bacterium]|nr:flippase [Chloroflexota bacterium]
MGNIDENSSNIDATNTHDIAILAKGTIFSLVGKVGGRALQLIAQIILARVLGPALYGLYIMGYTTYQLTSQVGLMGINDGVLLFAGQTTKKDDGSSMQVMRHALLLALSSGVFFCVLLFLLAPWIALRVYHFPELINILRGFAVTVGLTIGLRVTAAITRISQRMQFTFIAEDVLPVVINLSLIIVLVVILKWSIWGAIWAVMISYGVGLLLSFFFIQKIYPGFSFFGAVSPKKAVELLGFSFFTFLSSIFYLLLYHSTTLMVGYFLSPTHTGQYQVAMNASWFAPLILTGFSAIFAPMIPRINKIGDRKRLNKLYIITTKWGLYLYIPIFLILVLMPEQILGVVFGENYLAAATPLIILSFGNLVNLATGSVASLFVMTKHEKFWALLSGFSFLLTASLGIWLIPYWGINGAAFSMSAGLIVLNILAVFQIDRLLGLSPYDIRYLDGILAAFLTALFLILIKWLFPPNNIIGLIVVALFSFISFAIILRAVGLSEDDKEFLRMMISKNPESFIND